MNRRLLIAVCLFLINVAVFTLFGGTGQATASHCGPGYVEGPAVTVWAPTWTAPYSGRFSVKFNTPTGNYHVTLDLTAGQIVTAPDGGKIGHYHTCTPEVPPSTTAPPTTVPPTTQPATTTTAPPTTTTPPTQPPNTITPPTSPPTTAPPVAPTTTAVCKGICTPATVTVPPVVTTPTSLPFVPPATSPTTTVAPRLPDTGSTTGLGLLIGLGFVAFGWLVWLSSRRT